ncbi:unnamed protein product [Pleuronectes platessa]|uniref:Uncharacterized protein n=1 Tax=Pleuronectes platessa TaxID=8262 RepID=A0A9N7UYB8_PLEPL|nr:unnamed protein product [Pleuronectes platessa]
MRSKQRASLEEVDGTVVNIVLQDLPDLPTAFAYLFGLIYSLNLQGRSWLVAAAGRGTPDSNPPNHPLHISLVVSSLRRQIIPSTTNARLFVLHPARISKPASTLPLQPTSSSPAINFVPLPTNNHSEP